MGALDFIPPPPSVLIENGEQQDLTESERMRLDSAGLIYHCDECSSPDQYVFHVSAAVEPCTVDEVMRRL